MSREKNSLFASHFCWTMAANMIIVQNKHQFNSGQNKSSIFDATQTGFIRKAGVPLSSVEELLDEEQVRVWCAFRDKARGQQIGRNAFWCWKGNNKVDTLSTSVSPSLSPTHLTNPWHNSWQQRSQSWLCWSSQLGKFWR